ncbi:hypothetical protein OESDEN_10863 [Oesophagostomum dentatum]|uniref:Uncharacterized protein n=1 Tax=Oesophagostomum dentatum TaxID=61180 RepID=A0A0B1SZH4_OESDE|nr:hypothetical protein OESDEN_10863 [Oesophagostomum dentatum]
MVPFKKSRGFPAVDSMLILMLAKNSCH